MIDLNRLRTSQEETIRLLAKKDPHYDAKKLLSLDEQHRQLQHEIEELRRQKNELASQAKSGVTDTIREQSIQISRELKQKEAQYEEVAAAFKEQNLFCPNIPGQDIPEGGKEANRVVKMVGEKPLFSFEPAHHLELGNKLGWFDLEAAARIAKSNFVLYKGEAVKLMYALTQMMIRNNVTHGFEPVLPPVLANEVALETASNFPKFKDQVFAIPADGLYVTPTAEVNIASMYRDQILSADQLPMRMTAWTSCFRREAGGYGATERGLIRIHQFEKVELYTICEPEHSAAELERMVACAESILQQLGLHYRISLLAGQDCSFPSAKTYDIEVWLPGQKEFYEVSSCSNCTDFQARRGKIRYRKVAGGKTELVHTLNGSSLALPRLMVALMETYQQEDGSIALPEVLTREYWW